MADETSYICNTQKLFHVLVLNKPPNLSVKTESFRK